MFKEYFKGPGTIHLKEAIDLNTSRLPLYAKLTGGKSIPFSKKLILYERLSIPFMMITDLRSLRFRKHGVPVIAEDYVEMSLVGAFHETYPFPIHPKSAFKKCDGAKISKKIKQAYDSKRFEKISQAAEEEMKKLSETPGFHCMTRHLLESVIRGANNAPHHIALCEKKGIRSCLTLSRYHIFSHIPLFKQAAEFDEAILPIQAEGVPFLYQDVPPIAPLAACYVK